MSIASMALGITALITSIFLIGILLAPAGLILGVIALIKINKTPEVYGGKSFAIAGVATSGILVLFVPLILAIAVPNLIGARRAADEASAIAALRALTVAEAAYLASSDGKCGDLQALSAAKLIDWGTTAAAGNEKNGYRFIIANLPQGGCELWATPVSARSGNRSFYYSTEDGIIRGGPKKGLPADKNDFPLNGERPYKKNRQPKAGLQKPNNS
jgi:hypothetical protein